MILSKYTSFRKITPGEFFYLESIIDKNGKILINSMSLNRKTSLFTGGYIGMQKELNGMFWSTGSFDLDLPYIGDTKKACAIFKKNLVEITWNCMRSLENNPTTLPQTATILEGQSVGGISIFDLMQVKNYGDGCKNLIWQLFNDEFSLSIKSACLIHSFVAKEDALEWGVIRNKAVSLHNIKYVPPTENLSQILEGGFNYLTKEIKSPAERAIATFLFMARTQPFYDANKRTASLMMNGCLMKDGYFPITVLNREAELFHKELGKFYETGDANGMFKFFENNLKELYTPQQRKDFPRPSIELER